MSKSKVLMLVFIAVASSMLRCDCDDNVPDGPVNHAPIVDSITSSIDWHELLSGESVDMKVWAHDPDGDPMTYDYACNFSVGPDPDSCAVVFVAPSTEGEHSIGIEVTDDRNASTDTTITVTVCFSTSYGIYSEDAHCKLMLDHNSYLGLYSGGGATVVEFEDDFAEKCEGSFGKKATINVARVNQWMGWYVYYGTDGSPDTHTRDMSFFKGGTLRFCIKSEISDLVVGIRSGNVIAGNEHIVHLKNFVQLPTEDWVTVSIPLVQFTDASPKVDLSRMKVLFNIASNQASGGTDGIQTFWVDNVCWVRSGY